ncbi:MAG: CCA tRNA nucleotidyltransferase, partial [Thermoanaerobaculia bacterium]
MNFLQDLPHPQRRAIDLVREVAQEKECHPYIVGGPVRDILLGRPAIDIDLTLEHDASTLARALAKRLDGRVRSFPQFLTYKVTAPGFPEIDLATARKERYRKPGALPAVAAGRLKDDLIRRDFSINAIALDLLDGTMHDPAHGAQDIEARLVRVLHDRSFTDDPTRIFRAARLAVRLGFRIEEQTEELMRVAIETDALSTVSKERIWRELFLAMDEEEAPAILTDLSRRGALLTLFGHRGNGDLQARLEAIREQLYPEIDRYVLYTGALLRGDASPVDFEGSGFTQKRARAVVEIANELPRVLESLAAAGEDRERFRIYRSVSPEMLALLAAERPEERPNLQRFVEYENFRLPLRGNDLEVPGGPHIARALEQTREAVFTGEIPAEQARSYAKAIA